ncbi:MAG: hypothetical protein ABSA26_16880 [Thermoguttaceae bacterium]
MSRVWPKRQAVTGDAQSIEKYFERRQVCFVVLGLFFPSLDLP